MAIKMDGHTVTKLRLTDGAGNTVEKTLTEEGTIPTPTASVTITQNGTYPVADKATAVVNVPQEEPDLETLSVTENGNYTPSSGKDGFSEVSVDVPMPEPHLQDKTFTANGTYNAPSGYDGFGEVTVQVSGDAPTYQTKSVTPTESTQTVEPDSGYDALSSVTVGAIPDEYVIPTGNTAPITENGTHDVSGKKNAVVNVPTGTARTSSDVTADGGTVSVPAGLYESAVTKSVQTGTEGTPTATKGAVSNHAVTVTPSVENAEGYIAGGTQTGEGVNVSAAELASGTLEIDENTSGDGVSCVGYEKVKVNVQSGGTSYVSDTLPVYHAVVTLDEDYTSTSGAGNFPMSDTQVAELRAFLQNHLFGYTRTFQIIVAAQNDVVPAAARFIRGDLYGISSGAIAAIGNALTNANFAKYTDVDGATTVSKSWNPSNYGIRVTLNNNASTIYHDMRCDGSNIISIGAGTYDIWCIVIDDLSRLSGSGDSSGDEMSPGDALNILTGGVM